MKDILERLRRYNPPDRTTDLLNFPTKEEISSDDHSCFNMEEYQKKYSPSDVGKVCPYCLQEIETAKGLLYEEEFKP